MPEHAIAAFRDWLTGQYRADGRFEGIQVSGGADADGADQYVRIGVANRTDYEVRVALARSELQVGLGTENRSVNEALEQMVLDNGGDLSDLLADELCDLGGEPLPMEHFFERPAFRFIVRLPIASPEALAESGTRQRVRNILKACIILFQGCVDEV
jgi:hypothetical protein